MIKMTRFNKRKHQLSLYLSALSHFSLKLFEIILILISQSLHGNIRVAHRLVNNMNNSLDFIHNQYKMKKTHNPEYGPVNRKSTFTDYLNKASTLYQESSIDDAISMFEEAQKYSNEVINSLDLNNKNFSLMGSSFSESIGHMAMPFSVRVKMNEIFSSNKKYLVLYSKSANNHYLGLWKKYFNVIRIHPAVENAIENQFWPFYENVSYFQSHDRFYGLDEAHDFAARAWETQGNKPLLVLDDEAKEKGYKFLIENGFKDSNGWFVTLHVRNSFASMNGKEATNLYGRNAQIRDYELAISHIIKNGGFVVRIGDDDGSHINDREGFFDYSQIKNKKSILSTFFLAECKFMIGTNSGPICVPDTFGKPTLMTNAPGAVAPYFPNSIIIPKLIKDKSGKIINLNESLKSHNGRTHQFLNNHGNKEMFWRDNEPVEILDATKEMMDGINKKLSIKQHEYEKILRLNGVKATSVISNTFISKHGHDIL